MTCLNRLSIVFLVTAGAFSAQLNPTAESAVKLETALQSNPEDADSRARLLGYYSSLETSTNPDAAAAARASHLRHLEWLVEHHPESDLAGYGSNAFGTLKQLWLQQADRYPQDARVLKNAAQFFMSRDNGTALRLLKQAVALQPQDPELGQRLGTMLGMAAMNTGMESGLAGQTREDLRNCSNANVCGGAGVIISRVATIKRGTSDFSQGDADLGAQLLAKAQSLDPGNRQWMKREGTAGVLGGIVGSPVTGPSRPGTIRVAGNVQAANLIKQVPPEYPALAKQARIQGTVRFNATIGKDGTIENLTLVSGHPLLVQSAQEAARQWVYKPILLNGEPVQVITTLDVNFTLNGDSAP
ncbi:MAG: TonB family protein [Bryobacteraceae bacterium]